MLESEFEASVVDIAHSFGWRAAAFRPARTMHGWRTPVKYDGKGWPDLILAHRDTGRLLIRELKSAKGRIDDDQMRWLDDLAACGCDTGVWRPADWDGIVGALTFGRGTQLGGPR